MQKQKDFIRTERALIDQDRQDLDQKRQLSGMFIPDIKHLVSKMQYKSVQRMKPEQKSYINDNELRIKQSLKQDTTQSNATLTNMNAFIKKCSGDHFGNGDQGVFNCDLHKSMNKSTISLSNISCYHQNQQQKSNQSLTAIGSGRPSYKNYTNQSTIINNTSTSNLQIPKNFLRNASFKRAQQNTNQSCNIDSKLTLKQLLPQSTKNLLNISVLENIDDKENQQIAMNTTMHKNSLESILKGTAKFKESQNKLEQSYNSLIGSFCVPNPQVNLKKQLDFQKIGRNHELDKQKSDELLQSNYSFLSLDEEFKDNLNESQFGHSLSRDEL